MIELEGLLHCRKQRGYHIITGQRSRATIGRFFLDNFILLFSALYFDFKLLVTFVRKQRIDINKVYSILCINSKIFIFVTSAFYSAVFDCQML